MTQQVSEFLYMDPETGMLTTMIADGDGFRPANAADMVDAAWLTSLSLEQHEKQVDNRRNPVFNEEDRKEIDAFINQYAQSFPAG